MFKLAVLLSCEIEYICKKLMVGERKLMNAGCYQILFELTDNISVTVGAVGHFVLPQGFYIYTGKSNRELNNTLNNHLTKKKKIRFHIDYITTCEQFKVNSIYIYQSLFNPCLLHQLTLKNTEGHELIPNFGINSDDNCFSHLLYNINNPEKIIKKFKKSFKQVKWNI